MEIKTMYDDDPKNYIKKLVQAASDGNLRRLKEILELEPSCINEREDGSYTALIIAAYEGHEACVQELVSAGADLTPTDGDGTALENAMVSGCDGCVSILLEAGASIENLSEEYLEKYMILIEKHSPEQWKQIEQKFKDKAEQAKIKEKFKSYKMVNDFIVMKNEGKIEELGEIHTMFNLRAQTVTEIVDKNPATARGFDQFIRENSEEIEKAYEFSVWKGKKNKQPFKKVDRVKI